VHDKQVRRRRAVLGLLVVISLILLTAYFGESPSSPLHSVQRGIVGVLSPVQTGASKVLSPVRDVANWVSDTLRAKSQRDQLQRQVQQLNKEVAQYHSAWIQNQQLRQQQGLDQSVGLDSYHPLGADVIGRDPSLWYQQVTVDKGAGDGVAVDDPVTGDGALVGRVSSVQGSSSIVTLITDHSFAVAARVLDGPGDTGVLVPAVGNPNQLLLQSLPNHASISAGDQVVTAGFQSSTSPALRSLYPPGIPIGTVLGPVSQNELLNNGQVTVSPAADIRHFDTVQILTRPHAGTERAQVR
jgi:rod shape-determining protein MreC